VLHNAALPTANRHCVCGVIDIDAVVDYARAKSPISQPAKRITRQ